MGQRCINAWTRRTCVGNRNLFFSVLKYKSLPPPTFYLSITKMTDVESDVDGETGSKCPTIECQNVKTPDLSIHLLSVLPSSHSLRLNSMSFFLFSSCHFLPPDQSSHLLPWAPPRACSDPSGVLGLPHERGLSQCSSRTSLHRQTSH